MSTRRGFLRLLTATAAVPVLGSLPQLVLPAGAVVSPAMLVEPTREETREIVQRPPPELLPLPNRDRWRDFDDYMQMYRIRLEREITATRLEHIITPYRVRVNAVQPTFSYSGYRSYVDPDSTEIRMEIDASPLPRMFGTTTIDNMALRSFSEFHFADEIAERVSREVKDEIKNQLLKLWTSGDMRR